MKVKELKESEEPYDNDVTCPFCKDDGFDLAGLKNHLEHGDCEIFNKTDTSDFKSMF